jgi:hypothetical protein
LHPQPPQATIYDIAAYSHTPGFSGTGGAGILQAPSGIGCPVIPGFYDPLFGQRSAGKKVETASYDEYRNPYYEEYSRIPETLYYGNAVIYVGSITSVQSPKHEKFIGGKFEMVSGGAHHLCGWQSVRRLRRPVRHTP